MDNLNPSTNAWPRPATGFLTIVNTSIPPPSSIDTSKPPPQLDTSVPPPPMIAMPASGVSVFFTPPTNIPPPTFVAPPPPKNTLYAGFSSDFLATPPPPPPPGPPPPPSTSCSTSTPNLTGFSQHFFTTPPPPLVNKAQHQHVTAVTSLSTNSSVAAAAAASFIADQSNHMARRTASKSSHAMTALKSCHVTAGSKSSHVTLSKSADERKTTARFTNLKRPPARDIGNFDKNKRNVQLKRISANVRMPLNRRKFKSGDILRRKDSISSRDGGGKSQKMVRRKDSSPSETESSSDTEKSEDESKIPLCYRKDKTKVYADDKKPANGSDSEETGSGSDGEMKDSDQEKFGPEEMAASYFPSHADAQESSVSDTEEEDVIMGEVVTDDKNSWIQTCQAKLYYADAKESNSGSLTGTERLKTLQERFETVVLRTCCQLRADQPKIDPVASTNQVVPHNHHHDHDCSKHHHNHCSDSSSSSSSCHEHKKNNDKTEKRKKNRRKISKSDSHSDSHAARSDSTSHSDSDSDSSDSDSSSTTCSSDSEAENLRFKTALEEMKRKEEHPARLHKDLWFNEKDQMNDGPLCRCSWKAKQTGIAHSIYPGEKLIPRCDPISNNSDRLFHYRIEISPAKNFTTRLPTTIRFDDHDFTFKGFSLFFHSSLPEKLPVCNVVRWNIEYTIKLIKEEPPENFAIKDLDLFYQYFFVELLELYDVDLLPSHSYADKLSPDRQNSCPMFHVMPRFERRLFDDQEFDSGYDDDSSKNDVINSSNNHSRSKSTSSSTSGVEILSMNHVLRYLVENFRPLFTKDTVKSVSNWSDEKWDKFVDKVKGQLVVNSSRRPTTIRLDQIDRSTFMDVDEQESTTTERNHSTEKSVDAEKSSASDKSLYPILIHFGIRPAVLTYTGNPEYQRAWKQYVKFRHLLMMKSKLKAEDRSNLANKEARLQQLKAKASLKRDVTVELSSKGFYTTGIYPDLVQHGLMILVVICHVRLHWSFLLFEEERIKYKFRNRALLELCLTHPSYRSNYGTNPDHARNTLSNCGIRQPEYGNKRHQQFLTRKRGINTLIDIMSRLGSKKVKQSQVSNNERLEYLGDAVIEFLSTIHLFFMFPDLQEGGLATYRSSLVQNKHLAVLGKKLGLDDFMLYAHGPDLCHESDLRHAIANAFEALMGALFLDGGIDTVDQVYGNALFMPDDEPKLNFVWFHLPKHPLQEQEQNGDRHWVKDVPILQKLEEFEKLTGITFKHIRLLARAFTRKNIGYNFLTLGHNQRLEFLGDTVLQLVTSEYLYKHFPDHHEGHLSLLRSCLVKNKTQSIICDDLGITNFIVHPPAFLKSATAELRMKDKADLVEAFLGALYVDRGLDACKTFCRVCLYPRLRYFIMSQKWNDPKSQLQQCCLTVRNPDGGEPDIPVYKVISVEGPTNTRVYKVAVYFRSKRLSAGTGHSVQEAEMKAAESALIQCADLFPHLQKQKRLIRMRYQREFRNNNNQRSGGCELRYNNTRSRFNYNRNNWQHQQRLRVNPDRAALSGGAARRLTFRRPFGTTVTSSRGKMTSYGRKMTSSGGLGGKKRCAPYEYNKKYKTTKTLSQQRYKIPTVENCR